MSERRGATVYSVSTDYSASFAYVPTIAEARKLAREYDEWAQKNGERDRATITRHRIRGDLPRRELFCQLLNSESWCAESEEVA